MFITVLATLSLLIWIYLLAGRGGFWRVAKQLKHAGNSHDMPLRRVVVVIPARNEAEVIGRSLTSLFSQHYPSLLDVFLVDDSSTDGTAELARATAHALGRGANLTIIKGESLPSGWTGKMWAVSQGVAAAGARTPDYLLLADADILHGPDSLAELVKIAESGGYDLASYMVTLACVTPAEKALIPAFVFFFLMLYPPAWIQSRKLRTAAAAGGCILIRPEALKRMGGIAAIRTKVIDDCALARGVKSAGGRIWMGLTHESRSIRSYETFGEIGRMISRTAFNQLHHSTLLLVATIIGLSVTYLLPPCVLFSSKTLPITLGATAWALMAACYYPMVRFYRRSFLWSFTLPAVALFYLIATVHSAIQYWRGVGGSWKGRAQDLRKS